MMHETFADTTLGNLNPMRYHGYYFDIEIGISVYFLMEGKLNMWKKIIIMLLIINMLLLSSCSIGGLITKMSNVDNDEKDADARFVQVLKVINNKDKVALKAMFSKQALDKAGDIDGGMDYVFNLFQGKVVSWNNGGGPIVYGSINYGHITKEVNSFYTVDTDKQKYLFFLFEYTVDTDHHDNVGLYTLRVVKAEDEETQFSNMEDMKIAGIYKPKE
jgi:hypothetical protein